MGLEELPRFDDDVQVRLFMKDMYVTGRVSARALVNDISFSIMNALIRTIYGTETHDVLKIEDRNNIVAYSIGEKQSTIHQLQNLCSN